MKSKILVAPLFLAALIAGCSNSVEGKPAPSEQQSKGISLQGVQPCSLFTGQQQSKYKFGQGKPIENKSDGEPTCEWLGKDVVTEDPGQLVIVARTRSGLDRWNKRTTPHENVQVQGFKAIRMAGAGGGCETHVGVSSGQELEVTYFPGMSDAYMPTQQRCAESAKYADEAMNTLKAVK